MIKCRFNVERINIYGLLLFIFNVRLKKIMRHAAVSGCDPNIYETDLSEQWFAFERNIYSKRLTDGALREVTQKIEQSLLLYLQKSYSDEFYAAWDRDDEKTVGALIETGIKDVIQEDSGIEEAVRIQMSWQRLNLRQFKYLADADNLNELPLHMGEEITHSPGVFLDTELALEPGVPYRASRLEPGDVVFTIINDRRDIGVYLAHLLGARKAEETIPFSAVVEDVKEISSGLEIVVRFGPSIFGRAVIDPRKKIGVIRNRGTYSYRWILYPIVAFGAGVMYYFLSGR